MEVPHFIMIYMIHIIEGNVEECPCYAGLDEQLFYNAKYEMVPDDCDFSTITGINYTVERYRSYRFEIIATILENIFFCGTIPQDADGASTNSGSATSVRRINGLPEINFPPPPLQPSSAYEYYANINSAMNRSPQMDSLPSERFTYPSSEMAYESLPIDYQQNSYG